MVGGAHLVDFLTPRPPCPDLDWWYYFSENAHDNLCCMLDWLWYRNKSMEGYFVNNQKGDIMSAYKHLSDLLKICSVLPALVIMPAMADTAQYTNPADVENWSGNKYETTDTGRMGGVLKVANDDKIDEIKAGNVKDNSITLTKIDGYDGEVFGQGSVLYNNGIIGKITGIFENNSITNTSATASKATANGGAFALYAGTNIGSILADFIGNSVTAQYSGGGTTSYTGNSQISAGGGAMHIQGAFGDDEVIIGTISGDFTGNSANGDEYANGGAIYIKGGASDRDISDKYAVHIGKIEGVFTDNKVIAATNTTKNKKNSTGGAISVKVDADAGTNGDVVIDEIVGDFANNSVQTNTTDALGGAIYNEGTVNVTGNFSENMATATTTKGNGRGGAIYNVGTMNVSGTFNGNSANKQGGAIWNSGDLTIADGSVFSENSSSNGSAIYNAYTDGSTLTVGNNVKFSGNLNGAAINGGGEIKIGNDAEFTGNAGGITLSMYNKGSLEIGDNAVFTNNNAKNGGAAINVSANTKKFVMGDNAKFSDNTSTQTGGALYIANNDATLGTGYTFENNSAEHGGALSYNGKSADAVLSLNNFTFDTNHAVDVENGTGGALFISNGVIGTVNVSDSEFTGNTATVAGGAILQADGSTATMTIDGSAFNKNQAVAEGGAVVSDSTMLVKNSTFTGNKTTGTLKIEDVEEGKPAYYANNGGGAIFLYDESDTTVTDSVFSENTSGTYGGAIATRIGASADNSSLTLSNSLFSKNHADVYGGALYNTVKTTIGDGTSFTDNTAGFGGAIWNEGELNFTNTAQITFGKNISTGAGGAIYNKGTIDKLTHVLFQYNEAAQGGAINNSNLVGENQGGYIGEIAHATFANNDAGNSQGGAIRNQGKIGAINEVLFSANTSGNGGAFNNGTWGSVVESMTGIDFVSNTAIAEDGLGQGGAIANAGGIALIADSNFSGNQAGKIGGAIANVNPEDDDSSKQQHIKLQDVKFTSNVAGQHGGAIYNDTHGIIELGGTNTFSGNTADGVGNDIHNLGTITIADGETTISGGITGTGTLTVADGAVLDIGTSTLQQGALDMQGTLVAAIVNSDAFGKFDVDDFTIGDNAKLDLTLGAVGTYDLGIDIDLDQITYNDTIYQVSVDGSDIIVGTKSVQDITKDTNLTTNSAAVLVGLMNSDNYSMNIASLNAQSALASGDTEYVENESKKMLPHDTPIAQSVATSVQNQVLSVAANRMSGASMIGRSGGDLSQADYGIWAQGLINRAKYADKFTGDTKGISVGADALVDGKYTIGIGYAHNETDVDATRDTDISSDSIFVYGQYKPTQWYINAALNYTMANYTEEVSAFGINAGAEYDVNSFGGQVMTGYDFATGLTPEVGVRYLHISQDDYNNGLSDISGSDTDYLTGIAGVKYAFTIESDARLKFRPELRAAATYDFMSDVMTTTIDMPGVASYVLDGERLSRFGGEFGIGLTALYNGWEISVNYDLDLHEHYTSQAGMLKFRYNF